MDSIINTIKANLRKDRIMFAIRISIGVVLSITTATFFKIDFAPSTGVITLLTIDETQKETFRKTILRILSFIYTYSISWLVIDFFKLETTVGFAVAITSVTLITFLLRWDVTLSVNCVILIQLFLQNKPFTYSLFINETGRLLIGLFTAILMNWIFRVKYDYEEEREALEILEESKKKVEQENKNSNVAKSNSADKTNNSMKKTK